MGGAGVQLGTNRRGSGVVAPALVGAPGPEGGVARVRKPLSALHQKWRSFDDLFLKPLFGGLPREDDELDMAVKKLSQELAEARKAVDKSQAAMQQQREVVALMEQEEANMKARVAQRKQAAREAAAAVAVAVGGRTSSWGGWVTPRNSPVTAAVAANPADLPTPLGISNLADEELEAAAVPAAPPAAEMVVGA